MIKFPIVLHAAAVVVQHKACGFTAAAQTTANCSFAGNVTSTNAVITGIAIWSGNGGTTSFAVSDATNGAHTVDVNGLSGGNAGGQFSSKRNATGGFVQVTVTCVGGGCAAGWYWDLYEVSGVDNALGVLGGTRAEGVNGTSHQCADTGVSGTGIALCVGTFFNAGSADGGAKTGITSWTNDSFDQFSMMQRRIFTAATEVGAFSTANSVDYYGALALYREAAAAGSSSKPPCLLLGLSC